MMKQNKLIFDKIFLLNVVCHPRRRHHHPERNTWGKCPVRLPFQVDLVALARPSPPEHLAALVVQVVHVHLDFLVVLGSQVVPCRPVLLVLPPVQLVLDLRAVVVRLQLSDRGRQVLHLNRDFHSVPVVPVVLVVLDGPDFRYGPAVLVVQTVLDLLLVLVVLVVPVGMVCMAVALTPHKLVAVFLGSRVHLVRLDVLALLAYRVDHQVQVVQASNILHIRPVF